MVQAASVEAKLAIVFTDILVQAYVLTIVITDLRSFFFLLRSLLLIHFRDTQEAEILFAGYGAWTNPRPWSIIFENSL